MLFVPKEAKVLSKVDTKKHSNICYCIELTWRRGQKHCKDMKCAPGCLLAANELQIFSLFNEENSSAVKQTTAILVEH